MRPLRVNRYKQDPACCSIAASASLANFYNKNVTYELAKHVAEKEVLKDVSQGLFTGQIGMLLNHLGFQKVEAVTCDLSYMDYSWSKLSRKSLVAKLDEYVRSRSPEVNDHRSTMIAFRDFMNLNKNNKLTIDHHFADYIRHYLNEKIPIIVTFNWTMFFKFPKFGSNGLPDHIKGYPEFHAVVCRGFNDNEAHIVDSHHAYYKHKLKRFKDGYYTVPWEELMTIIGAGDLIIPTEYDKNKLQYELV